MSDAKDRWRSPHAISPAAIAFGLLVLTWTSVMLPGFAFPWVNNVFHVPIVLGYAASAEGPHDAFTQSLSNFVSGFWPALGLAATEGNIYWLFFVVHSLGRLLFISATYGLIRTIGASQWAALSLAGVAGIAPVFKSLSIVGHNETLATYLSHTEFAIAMIPGCWWLLAQRRWVTGAAAIGLLFNVNAFLSIWTIAAALAGFVALRPAIVDFWRRLFLCGVAFSLAALPTGIWILSTIAQQSPGMEYRAYLLSYYPFHTFVHVQWEAVARFAAYLVAAGAGVTAALRTFDPLTARFFGALLVGYVAVFLYGIPLPYVTDSRLLLNLFPLRIDAVIIVAVSLILLGWAGRALDNRAEARDTLPLAIALTLLIGNTVAALLLIHAWAIERGMTFRAKAIAVATGGVLLLLLAMQISPTLGKEFVPLALLFVLASLVAVAASAPGAAGAPRIACTTAALACTFLPTDAQGLLWPLFGLAACCAAGLGRLRGRTAFGFASSVLTCCWLASTGNRLALIAALATTLLGMVLALAKNDVARRLTAQIVTPVPIFVFVTAIGTALSAYAAWRGSVDRPDIDLKGDREAQLWARGNTPPDTLFLTIGVDSFTVLSRRPTWGDGALGAAVMWKPEHLAEWQSQRNALSACHDTTCYTALARRNRIGWIVARPGRIDSRADAGLCLRFANRSHVIFTLDAGHVCTPLP